MSSGGPSQSAAAAARPQPAASAPARPTANAGPGRNGLFHVVPGSATTPEPRLAQKRPARPAAADEDQIPDLEALYKRKMRRLSQELKESDDDYNVLVDDFNRLLAKHRQLKAAYKALEDKNREIQAQHDSYKQTMDKYQSEMLKDVEAQAKLRNRITRYLKKM